MNASAGAWSRSRDGGATWSAVAYEPALPEPSCQGSIVRLDDGHILMAHPSKVDERAELTLRLSEDQGYSWPIARVLEPGSGCVFRLGRGSRRAGFVSIRGRALRLFALGSL